MRQLILTYLSLFLFAITLHAQTWSSNPAVNTYTYCYNKPNINCGFGNWYGSIEITAKLTNLTSTSATVQIERCSGMGFLSNGEGYISSIHPNLCSGLVNGFSTFIQGNNSVSITFNHNVLPGQTKSFYPTLSILYGGTYFNYYCDSITISSSASSCIAWTNPPSDTLSNNAQNYLCQQGIIISTQNGQYNQDSSIRRRDLARICYLALKQVGGVVMPSDSFPTPFNDMQNLPSNTYWLTAAKALSYLEYGDGKSSFDRSFFNFNPMNGIERKYAMKVFLEAFNIAPDNTTPSPFIDVPTTDDMYGYIKRAHALGLVSGYACGSDTCFNPWGKMTREQAFIILYRILTFATISKPTASQLNDANNYFVPNNLSLANLSKLLSSEQANFDLYEKTSFSLPGKGLPLEFTHRYNSALTELPDSILYPIPDVRAFSKGWTHNYNMYVVYKPGYNFTDGLGNNDKVDSKYYIYWGDGSMEVYNADSNKFETKGTYHTITFPTNKVEIKDKAQLMYEFTKMIGTDVYRISKITDRNNNQLSFAYTNQFGAYLLTTVTDVTTGRNLQLTYNFCPQVHQVTESGLNRNITFNYYNSIGGNLMNYTNPNGGTSHYFYNNSGAYSPDDLLTQITLPKGNKVKCDYANRKLTATRTLDASNVVTSSSTVNWTPNYSVSQGAINSTQTDTAGITTNYAFNNLGNPTSITNPSTTINNIVYDAGINVNKPKSMAVQGINVTMNYDNMGNLLSITKNGIKDSFTYNGFNDVLTHRDGNNNLTSYGYDALGNLLTITRPSGGGAVNITRNTNGQPLTITNPSGIVTTMGYNAFGNLNSIQLPLGISNSSTYDNASRLKTKTDALSNTTTYDYDNNDNLTKITDALAGITELGYDQNDNNTSIKNAKNETTTKTYSFAEDWLKTEVFGPHTKTFDYYVDGKIKTYTKGNGTYNYTYDALGRLSTDGYTSYTYDSRNNIASITNANGMINLFYDLNDRLDYYTDYYGNTVDYTYDNNHNLTQIIYPGNKIVSYTYDANNRCTHVTDWLSQQTRYFYLTDDRIDSVRNANGTYTKYLYDAAGRNIGIRSRKSGGQIISEYTFTLDNHGNHLSESMNEPALNAGLNTLASATVNHNPMPNNRIQNAGATTFTHDPAGNITNRGSDTYTFDINDNLLTVNGTAMQFSYDGAGNRRQKTISGNTTRYVLSILGMSQVLMETNASNAVTNYYVYGPLGLISRIKPNNTTHYYHYDFRGSTIALSDAGQNLTHTYSYDAFGNVLSSNEPANDLNPFRYVGQQGVQYETPTLTFMRARYADLSTGRFISEDPIWATNLYPYSDNNPVMGVDPKGESVENIFVNNIIGTYIPDKPMWFIEKGAEIALDGIAKQTQNFYLGATSLVLGKAGVTFDIINEAFNPANAGNVGRYEELSAKVREQYLKHLKIQNLSYKMLKNKNLTTYQKINLLKIYKESSLKVKKYEELFNFIEYR